MADELVLGASLSGSSLGEVLTVRDIEGPEEKYDDIDISSNVDVDTSTEFMRRFKKGVGNPGEITATVVFTVAGYAAARTANAERTGQSFTIVAKDDAGADACTFTTGDESYVNGVSPSYPWEAELVYDITIKCSGKSTFS